MTTRGDVIVRDSSNATARLAVGSANTVLKSDGTDPAYGQVATAMIADDAVTLAKMAPGTDGNLITYDASGNPAYVAAGSATEVLTSQGAGSVPVFAAAAAGGLCTQFITAKLASNFGSTSNTLQDTGLDASITPTSASHILYVTCSGFLLGDHGYNYDTAAINIQMRASASDNTATLLNGATIGCYGADRDGDYGAFTLSYSAAAGGTSALPFGIFMSNLGSNGSANNLRSGALITIMEFAP
tara:strand:- start:192 stop:920 length:729 start_codon:yes stop_codon:yes gene_type:complete